MTLIIQFSKKPSRKCKKKDLAYYLDVIYKKADEYLKDNKGKEAKILRLISHASGMILSPKSQSEPFKPFMTFPDKRSAIPSDFSTADIEFLSSIVTDVSDYKLRARIADLCWFGSKPRDPNMALVAIDAYTEYTFDDIDHYHNSKDTFRRAIFLCNIHRSLTLDRRIKIRDYLQNVLDKPESSPGLKCAVFDLLHEVGFEKDTEHIIECMINDSENAQPDTLRMLLERVYKLVIAKNRNNPLAFELNKKIATTYISEAEMATSSMFSAGMYRKALEEYHKIPKSCRATYVSEADLTDLKLKIGESNKQSLSGMSKISSEPMDISELVFSVEKYLRGKELFEAILSYVFLAVMPSIERLKEEAIEKTRTSILSAMIPTEIFSGDGRLIARKPTFNIGDSSHPDNEAALEFEMIQSYKLVVDLAVKTVIIRGLDIIQAEHVVSLDVLVALCYRSSIVPSDRVIVWAKGLLYGFEGEFTTSIHILAPQVEHCVRLLLKSVEAITTTIDTKGIETENGLSTLLDHCDIGKVIDADLLFELKALFTVPAGFNVRNDVAHGLLDSYNNDTISAIYAWYFCLRLIIANIPFHSSADCAAKSNNKRKERLKRVKQCI